MNMKEFTRGNEDNLEKALDGLGQFCHNWCMNCKETEAKDDLVFRCKECNFLNEDESCEIKKFITKNCKGDYGRYTSMGSL